MNGGPTPYGVWEEVVRGPFVQIGFRAGEFEKIPASIKLFLCRHSEVRCSGPAGKLLTPELPTELAVAGATAVGTMPGGNDTARRARINAALVLVLAAPEYIVQK